ncbi:MAG: CHASE2 domain-containing protein, partial [Leptolyngbyaceae cyanobacterium]
AVAPPPALKALGQVSSNDVLVDADNVVRRGLISVDDSDGSTVYGFSLYLALLYLDAEGIGPQMGEDGDFGLGKAQFTPLLTHSGGYVWADAGGYQFLLNPVGATGSFETVSLMDVLNDEVPDDWATDRIVLIGAVSESFKDLVHTAYSSGLITHAESVPGVELHANFASQIVGAALGERSLIQGWPEWLEWSWTLLWSAVGATLAWQFRRSSTMQLPLVLGIVGAIAPILLLLGSAYGAILAGWWIPVVPPGIALVGSAIAVTGYVAQTAGSIRKTFGRYLGDEIVDTLLESPQGLKMGGERRHITILTSDVRGFTSLSEQLAPEEVIKILNFYLEHMAEVITHYGGIIDDFIGDGILVVFGAPTSYGNDAERAVACAIGMQLAMDEVNQTLTKWGFAPLEMGIGINTGEAVVGNMGSTKRTKYSVLGSHVNLAFRIETYTTGGQVLISEHTLKAAETAEVDIRSHTEVMPKGVKTPVTVYDVGGIRGQYSLQLPQDQEEWLPLAQPIPLTYFSLQGKHVAEVGDEGAIAQLSPQGAVIQVQSSDHAAYIVPLSNLKLHFRAESTPDMGDLDATNLYTADLYTADIYAKVVAQTIPDGHFAVRFTSKAPFLQQLWERLSQENNRGDFVG